MFDRDQTCGSRSSRPPTVSHVMFASPALICSIDEDMVANTTSKLTAHDICKADA
jgi:hypothetical protein